MTDDDLPFSPAAERNQAPILAMLREVLPAAAQVLEIAAGTGQHSAHFAASNPGWEWQPSDVDPTALPTIARRCSGLANVRAPIALDVLARPWPCQGERYDAVYCANMLHIAPWATAGALMQGAAAHLVPAGLLVVYGPFIVEGEPTAPGNVAFDLDLRRRNGEWGLRSLAQVVAAAAAAGLGFERRVAMPANNLTLVFRNRGADAQTAL